MVKQMWETLANGIGQKIIGWVVVALCGGFVWLAVEQIRDTDFREAGPRFTQRDADLLKASAVHEARAERQRDIARIDDRLNSLQRSSDRMETNLKWVVRQMGGTP